MEEDELDMADLPPPPPPPQSGPPPLPEGPPPSNDASPTPPPLPSMEEPQADLSPPSSVSQEPAADASMSPPPPLALSSDDSTPSPSSTPSPPPPPTIIPPPSPASTTIASTSVTASIGTTDRPPARPSSVSSPLHTSGATAAATTANRSVANGVSPIAASVLQASMLRQVSSIPEANSDDSEDDLPVQPMHRATMASASPSTLKKLSSASNSSFTLTHMKWEVEKANRYGLKDSRLVVLDLAGHAVRFFEKDKLKSEVPLNQISSVVRRVTGEELKRVDMHFKEDRRSYDLYFRNAEEAGEFERLLSSEIDNSATSTRAYSQSVQRAGSTAPSPSSSSSSVHFMPPSPAHFSHNSTSYNSLSGTSSIQGRDASESIAIHSEMGHGNHLTQQLQQELEDEDHNAYLDYPVIKKNRYGLKQQRILVINSMHGTMLLLDEKRKFKKEFSLASILSVEIPRTKTVGEAQCYVVFGKESGQKPFHLFFADTVDRLHFCERLVSLAPHELSIKDESDSVEDSDSHRFGVLKINKVGVKKKRIVVLRTKERVLRSFNREKSYKDVSFSTILKWEKPHADRFRLNIWLSERPHPLILIFPDPVSRERFVTQSNYIRQVSEEEASGGNGSPSGTVDPSAAAPSSVDPPLSIFVGSFNLGNAPFTYESMDAFLPPMKHDLYVIGLQECSKGHRDQWLMELRNHIQQNWKSSAGTSSTCVEDDKDDTAAPYALLGVVKLWEILLMVLIRRPLAAKVTNLCMDTVATGVGDVLGNKGGCGLSFTYQESNLCFVACHLAARSERVVQRAENYMKILKQLQLGLPNVDILSHNDHVFWFGDLNYRNDLEYSEVIQLVKMKEWKTLCTYDQLGHQMRQQLVFAGFQEAPLRFAPTYRWERKENVFSNKKFQAPSWTDRVLWHSLPGLGDLKLESYSSAPNVMGSDHRPLMAVFQLASRRPYTGRLQRSHQLQPIRLMRNENPNIIAPDNVAFAAAAPTSAITLPPPLPPRKSSAAPPSPSTTSKPTTPASANSLLVDAAAPYQHYTTASGANASASVACRPSSAVNGGPGSSATLSFKNFTPYLFTPPLVGPLYTPPMPHPLHVAEATPLLGTTKEFAIVLQNVKCTFSSVPRGDFTLTASAPFLQSWPTTTAVSYPFGLEVGCHWDELILPPFIHDLYYLYTRHLLFSISVPSLAASTSGQNVEQTGMGTCIGTVSVALGTICANIFRIVSQMKPKESSAATPDGQPAVSTPVNPNSPGLLGDHGSYYFIEPIHRDGLYCGQLEGFIKLRYGSPSAPRPIHGTTAK